MRSLFCLCLTSSIAFSFYLWAAPFVVNPLAYVFIGWAPVVAAWALGWFWERSRLWVANKTFECFITDRYGLFWDGEFFMEEDSTPWILYNDVQIDAEVKKIIHTTGVNDLYIRIVPSREPEDEEN